MKTRKILAILAASVCLSLMAFGQTWVQTLPPNTQWQAIACSADGSKLFAVSGPGAYTYATSTNSGAIWTTYTEPQSGTNSEYGSWNTVALSADGNTVVAMNYHGVWSSTNFGNSWFSNNVPSVNFWVSVALSADGTKAVAVDGHSIFGAGSQGGIYASTNSGRTWNQTTAPVEPWACVASSTDGTTLTATAASNPTVPVYLSTNSGATWAPTASPTNVAFYAAACSADGRKLIVAGLGAIYTSTNLGNTWTSNNVPFVSEYWDGVASSADGTRLIAVSEGACDVFTSTNSGLTWLSNSVPHQIWSSAASSADGTKLAVASIDYPTGGIYTSQSTPAPQLNSTLSNGSLTLSWLIPSTNFILQQNSNLTTTNWSGVTNTPMLNLTNLQYQASLPATGFNAFYRLKTP